MDATQQDAEQVVEEVVEEVEEQKEEKEEYVDREVQGSREDMLKRIVDERESEVMNDMAEANEDIDDTEEVEEVEEVVEVDESPPVWKHEGQWVTQVKVNGQDVVVPFDGLKSSHQKDVASQQRFQQAAQKEECLLNRRLSCVSTHRVFNRKNLLHPRTSQKMGFDYNKTVEEYHQALYEDNAAKSRRVVTDLDGAQYCYPKYR